LLPEVRCDDFEALVDWEGKRGDVSEGVFGSSRAKQQGYVLGQLLVASLSNSLSLSFFSSFFFSHTVFKKVRPMPFEQNISVDVLNLDICFVQNHERTFSDKPLPDIESETKSSEKSSL
jgi:hypothetical protein